MHNIFEKSWIMLQYFFFWVLFSTWCYMYISNWRFSLKFLYSAGSKRNQRNLNLRHINQTWRPVWQDCRSSALVPQSLSLKHSGHRIPLTVQLIYATRLSILSIPIFRARITRDITVCVRTVGWVFTFYKQLILCMCATENESKTKTTSVQQIVEEVTRVVRIWQGMIADKH